MTVCQHFKNGFCKYRQQCENKHVKTLCPNNLSCQNTECEKRHPKIYRNFAQFRNCKYVRRDYTHSQDNGNNNNINELQKEVYDLKKQVQCLSQSRPEENEPRIKILEDDAKALQLEIKNFINMYK